MAKRTVLVVEGREHEARLLEEGLRVGSGRAVLVLIRNTDEAERYLFGEDARIPTPSLVLLDMEGSHAKELALLKRVRSDARTRAIPVVILSTRLEDLEVQNLYRSGANSYLDRPAESREFLSMVSAAANYWCGLNMSAPAGR